MKRKKNIIEKYVIAGFVISILLVLIHKFNFIVVSDIIYTILPHIKVSTDYGICIFLLVLITIFANINKAIVYIYIFLIQILILLTLFTSTFFSIDRTLLHSLAQQVRLFESTTTD